MTYTFDQKDNYVPPTPLDATNPYWLAFKSATDDLWVLTSIFYYGSLIAFYLHLILSKQINKV